jgi:uncharacterized protein YprB with RNaseH-like and TPR domain
MRTSKLRNRLSRLRPLPVSSLSESSASESSLSESSASESSADLRRLRDSLQRHLARAGATSTPLLTGIGPSSAGEGQSFESLGFEALSNVDDDSASNVDDDSVPRSGRYVRAIHYEQQERVGMMPLSHALSADSQLLSLLALTPALEHCTPRGALYLDTETSGFGNGTGNVAFLVGLCFVDASGQFVLEQLLLREPGDERPMLEHVLERIAACEYVVSYNGKSFDLPVLRGRCVMNRLPPPADRPHLDLLHVARRVHKLRSWRKSLTSLEREALSYRRGHDIAGEEVALRYRHYMRTGNESLLHDAIVHNARDVLTLVALVGLYGERLGSAVLPAEELASMARVMKRAGDMDAAWSMVDRALARGAGHEALRVRAEIAKARGDRRQALDDFERVAKCDSDAGVRLELAKLYEHYLRRPDRALSMVQQGTAEKPHAEARRRSRLERKSAKQRAKAALASTQGVG